MEKICGSSVRRVDQIDSSPVVRDRGDQEKIEYRPNHQLRFKGKWSIFGPNIWKDLMVSY
jgi:hypothetical protein